MHFDFWTLGLQAVNVLVLIWILHRFLFRPVLRVIDQRQAAIRHTLDEAEATRQEANTARDTAAGRLANIRSEAETILADAQALAAQHAAARLAEADRLIDEKRQAAQASLAVDRAAAASDLVDTAGQLGTQIALKLLGRLPADIGFAAFLDGLATSLESSPPAIRQGLTDAARSNPGLEIHTAAPLPAADMEQCRARLAQVFGFIPNLRSNIRPEILAGLELHSPHFSLTNSWGADLAALKIALRAEQHSIS